MSVGSGEMHWSAKKRKVYTSFAKNLSIDYLTELVIQLCPSPVTDADGAVIGKYAAENGNLAPHLHVYYIWL